MTSNRKTRLGRNESDFSWREADDPDKKSPNSLRLTLHALRVAGPHAGGNKTQFYEALNNYHLKGNSLYGLNSIPTSLLKQAENGKNALKYAVLEAYARMVDVPLAAIFLVSRFVAQADSRSEEEGREETGELISGMRRILDAIEKAPEYDELTPDEIFQLISSYNASE